MSGLETLPSQVADLAARTTAVESQIVQLRTELRGEFSAIRSEMATKREMQEGFVAITTELGQQIFGAKSEARAMFEELLSRIAAIGEGRKPRR